MRDFDVVSADDLGRSLGAGPDIDADTQLDDRSVDEILRFALGTDERRFHHDAATPPVAAPSPPPIAPQPPMPPVFVAQAPVAYPPEYPVAAYPVHYTHTGPFPYADMGPPPASARSSVLRWGIPAVALCLVAGSALALGKFLFAGADAPAASASPTPPPAAAVAAPVSAQPAAPAAQPVAPAVQPAAPAVQPAAPDATAAAPAEPLTAQVVSLEHPAGDPAIFAPSAGVVTRAYLVGTRPVAAGEKLFEITSKRAPTGKERQLSAKVKELERLAAQDPVYEEFLVKARRDRDRLQPQSSSVLVRANKAGVLQSKIAEGDRVASRAALASRADGDVWLARAALHGTARPGTQWSCTVADPAAGGKKSGPCSIERIVEDESAIEVTVRIAARDVTWLDEGARGLELAFGPPAR